ncbi:MAG TPA: cupin domain-containing protein [Chloroflexota bacterium]|jgi:4-carboxymuconolactone decarboxylase|nr:cupin domain-containing protein [Chloroflexota bacterium]
MKVVRISELPVAIGSSEMFIGLAERQVIVDQETSSQVRVALVTFKDGAVNRMHTHDVDQILVITAGEGIVQAEGKPEQQVKAGDVAIIPAGERHWHGAAPGKTMSHLTITTPRKAEG